VCQSRKAKNLSALDNPLAFDSKLKKELEAQRLAGPFQSPPLSPFWISPLGVVPKKVPGEFPLVHHLSFPKGASVNDGIPPEHTSVHYATIDGAIELIKRAGPGCFLAKTDIKNAFCIKKNTTLKRTSTQRSDSSGSESNSPLDKRL